MVRNILAVLLAAVAVALFGYLVFQSRPIGTDEQQAHNILATQTRSSIDDYRALIEQYSSARHAGRAIGPSSGIVLERLNQSQLAANAEKANIGDLKDGESLGKHLAAYVASAGNLQQASTEFVTRQNLLANAMDTLRTDSARIVQQLRSDGAVSASQNAFILITGALDYGRSNSQISPDSLRSTLDKLSGSDQPQLLGLLDAVEVVLAERPLVDAAWERIASTDFIDHAEALWLSEQARFNARRSQVDRNRVLLSVYAALLLAALAFLTFRLLHSYRILNSANAELEGLNDTLEERVDERTAELSSALSELRESQVQLVQAAKMSSLGQLVAGISHEINTPLLYLRSNADLIQERLDQLSEFLHGLRDTLDKAKGPNRDQQAFISGLKVIDKQLKDDGLGDDVEDCRSLINDSIEGLEQLSEMALSLKDFSRLDRAPVAKYDVNEGLDRTLLIAKNALKHKVEIIKQYGEVGKITCSPSQINQVFLNLITNAAQAIEEQGDIAITTSQDDESVRITVADNGCGIPEHILEKIRDPFFTTKQVGEGTGLGLAIVEKIINSHGGKLHIESEVGKGSAFTVVLPRQAQDQSVGDDDDFQEEAVAMAV
ncbi:MAG: ATP-binding protein [Gammaproteobacteria bacterium]